MSKPLAMLVIGLFLGGGGGFVAALTTDARLDGHSHGDDAHQGLGHGAAGLGHDHAVHGHGERDVNAIVEAPAPAPTLAAALRADPHGGWALHLKTEYFRFTPEAANGDHLAGEGHAHAFADGDKIARIYGPWTHFASLPDGAKTLTITLNANDHRTMFANGAPISVTIPIPR